MIMNCPNCKEPMDEGTLKLKADGAGTGLASFSASLKFDNDLVEKDKYKPIVGIFGVGGKKITAYRCEACSIVSFKYDKYKFI